MIPSAESSKANFLKALLATSNLDSGSPTRLNSELKEALLKYGSETEDNTEAVKRIGVGKIGEKRNGQPSIGLNLAASGLSLADVVNTAEGSPLPEGVLEYHPEVTQEDWDAILRVLTLVLTAFESDWQIDPTGVRV